MASMAVHAADKARPVATAERATHVEAVGVSKQYGGPRGLLALEDISLSIANGEFVSILGPSGCGKSTFLRCIAGLEKPTTGTIRVGGQVVVRPPENLGMVFQRDVLLDWRTVLDNLFLPIDFRHQSRKPYLDRALTQQFVYRRHLRARPIGNFDMNTVDGNCHERTGSSARVLGVRTI